MSTIQPCIAIAAAASRPARCETPSTSRVPHFIHVRFYTYAYAFAHLVAFSLLAPYREAFVPAWLELLGNGASRSPQDLLEPVGVDLRDPETWALAFGAFDRCIAEAEASLDALDAS